ncbi:MAG: aldehyde ferredoxin oxidoreductase family protein [Bradymonadales bacterium]|nr:aldehyde ferredoxin oxidoreductase family protein [Bradymonadales bacterium]
MANGTLGKILVVDLTAKSMVTEPVPEETYRQVLGGLGLGAHYCYQHIPAGADPLGPDNILGFCPGLLTGTGALFAGRFIVVGKSPLTGGWGDANCGGHFGPEIKRAGYDAIFVKGRSEQPTYLFIRDGQAELRDARHLWGKDSYDTEEALRTELKEPGLKVACIAEGGERKSLISGIVTDGGRLAARSGLGAVMGSKMLKAIAIKGTGKVGVVNKKALTAINKEYMKRFKTKSALERNFLGKALRLIAHIFPRLPSPPRTEGASWKAILRRYGTSGITVLASATGDSPVKNWKGSGRVDFPISRAKNIGDDAVLRLKKKSYGCAACPVACGAILGLDESPSPFEETHRPEYETLSSFGSMTLTDDLGAIMKANDICNRAGIDTISCGSTVAFAMECFEQGLLTIEDTGGLTLKWGDGAALVKLTELIARREGIGDLLADGVKRAAERIGKGAEGFAMHAGGQELPMHDSRHDPGYAVAYQCEPTPGRHTLTCFEYMELLDIDKRFSTVKVPVVHGRKERRDPYGKAPGLVLVSKFVQVANGCGLCLFGLQLGDRLPVFEWVNAATGWNLGEQDYFEIGARIQTIRQAFNAREGITPADFRLPERARGVPPLAEGPLRKITVDTETMGREYFQEYGWDYNSGKPTLATLERLGLEAAKRELYP